MNENSDDISSDVYRLFDEFYDKLVASIKPLEIIHLIDGFSQSDIQLITDITRNEGDQSGNKQLMTILKNNSSDTGISFLRQLQYHNAAESISEEVIDYIYNHNRRIYDRVTARDQPERPKKFVKSTSQRGHALLQGPSAAKNVFRNDKQIELHTLERRITEDTPLDDVPNVVFGRWASILNIDNKWEELANVLLLTRGQVKILKHENCRNPASEILDMMNDKLAYTVQGLLHFLECAGLIDVCQEIRNGLRNPIVSGRQSTQTTGTDRRIPALGNCQQHQQQEQSQVTRYSNTESGNRNQNRGLNMTAEIMSRPSESHVTPEQTNQQMGISTLIPHAVNRSITQDTAFQRVQLIPPLNQSNQQTGISSLIEHSDETSIPQQTQVQSVIRQHEISDDTDFENNAQQEGNALDRAINSPINLHSYRDIQNSIPDISASGRAMGPLADSIITDMPNTERIRIQPPGSSNTSHSHVEHKLEQEYTVLADDVRNQLRLSSDDEEDTQPKVCD